MNLALLVLRLVVGLTLAAHGAQKLFGWFGGGGVAGTTAGMEAMGPEAAGFLGETPLGAGYRAIAPRPEDWPVLVTQVTSLMKDDYDWTAEARSLQPPTMLVAGDADGLPPRHAVEFFELLGGGLRDASWDRSGMTRHRLAILPGATHYDINVLPALAVAVNGFLDEAIPD